MLSFLKFSSVWPYTHVACMTALRSVRPSKHNYIRTGTSVRSLVACRSIRAHGWRSYCASISHARSNALAQGWSQHLSRLTVDTIVNSQVCKFNDDRFCREDTLEYSYWDENAQRRISWVDEAASPEFTQVASKMLICVWNAWRWHGSRIVSQHYSHAWWHCPLRTRTPVKGPQSLL